MAKRFSLGISRLEFAVAAAVFGILATLLLGRLLQYQASAERMRFDLALREMQEAERVHVAMLMVTQKPVDYARLAQENPVTWLAKKPEGYVENTSADASNMGDGVWTYNGEKHELLYRPRFDNDFSGLVGKDGLVHIGMLLVYGKEDKLPKKLILKVNDVQE